MQQGRLHRGRRAKPDPADEPIRSDRATRYTPVSVATYDSPNGLFYRVRVGRLSSEAAARKLADQLESGEKLDTFVVRLDD